MVKRKTSTPAKPKGPLTKNFLSPPISRICLIGCGGTGGYVAEGLAKMMAGYRLQAQVMLVDPDRIEDKNTYRQKFFPYEIGQPKAQALSFRLNQQHGLAWKHHDGCGVEYLKNLSLGRDLLVVSCVDKASVRRQLPTQTLWLDVGNELSFGQAVLGNCDDPTALRKEKRQWSSTPVVELLPSPALKCGWRDSAPEPPQDQTSCADHVFGEQGPFVNEWAAMAALSIVQQILIGGKVCTPAIYFDVGKGRMMPARLEPGYLV